MNLFFEPEISKGIEFLNAEESYHCCGILRKRTGDIIHIVDGVGQLFEASIAAANSKKCLLKEVKLIDASSVSNQKIHLAIAPTKNIDRIEWLVEKAGEIGIDEISFVLCTNSERKIIKTERLVKKAIAALKQSKNLFLMRINELVTLADFIKNTQEDSKYIAVVEHGLPHFKTVFDSSTNGVVILIGPEGDFTHEEAQTAEQAGFRKVSLGKAVLRTETAGLLASYCAVLAFGR